MHTKEEVLADAAYIRVMGDDAIGRSRIESMLRAYAALLGDRPVGWQPIETAPRDGTIVILTIQWDDDPVIASWQRGLWLADQSHLHVCGDASLDSDIPQKDIIGWAPILRPLWRIRQAAEEQSAAPPQENE